MLRQARPAICGILLFLIISPSVYAVETTQTPLEPAPAVYGLESGSALILAGAELLSSTKNHLNNFLDKLKYIYLIYIA
jgi:hypothetical protein